MQTSRVVSRPNNSTALLAVFSLAHFCHHLSTAAAVPLLPMIRDSFQLDYFRSGLLLSAFSIVYGLVQLPMGVIADRYSKRSVLSLGLLGTGAACIAAGLSGGYLQILMALLLMGVAGSTYHAPSSAFLAQVFDRETRGRVLGIHIVGGTLGLMAAPLVAIFVSNVTGGWRAAFIVMGLPILLSGVLLWTLAGAHEAANREQVAREKAEPLPLTTVVRLLGTLVIVAILTQLLVAGMNSFLPLYLVDKHGAPKDMAGLVMAVVFAAGVVGAPVGGAISDRLGRKPIILMSVVGVGPMVFLVTILPLGPAMIGAIALYGLFQVFRLPAIESQIADVIPIRQRTTVLGGYNLVAQQTTGIATPIFGWVMDQFGLNTGFALLAAIGLGSALLVLAFWRKV